MQNKGYNLWKYAINTVISNLQEEESIYDDPLVIFGLKTHINALNNSTAELSLVLSNMFHIDHEILSMDAIKIATNLEKINQPELLHDDHKWVFLAKNIEKMNDFNVLKEIDLHKFFLICTYEDNTNTKIFAARERLGAVLRPLNCIRVHHPNFRTYLSLIFLTIGNIILLILRVKNQKNRKISMILSVILVPLSIIFGVILVIFSFGWGNYILQIPVLIYSIINVLYLIYVLTYLSKNSPKYQKKLDIALMVIFFLYLIVFAYVFVRHKIFL